MSQFMNGLYNLLDQWQPLIWIVAALVIFVSGIACMIPMQEIRDKGRKAFPGIVLGCGVALMAVTIAKEISAAWAF